MKHGSEATRLYGVLHVRAAALLPCPTFMMTFMARLLHTPPSRFSRPSTVPLEVAAGRGWGVKEREREKEEKEGVKGDGERGSK